MEKIHALRAALVAALPEYVQDPDGLRIFVDKGRLVSRYGASLDYEWRYTVRIEFHDFTRSPDEIAVPLLVWLREHQRERLMEFAREDGALGFMADVIDATTWDVVFAFELSEAVKAVAVPGGGYRIDRVPEPGIPGEEPIAGLSAPRTLGQLIANGDALLP